MMYTLWFLLGLVLVSPLLWFAHQLRLPTMQKLLGRSLVLAAVIYIGFSAAWGNASWTGIEALGVLAYGVFYLLAVRHSLLWLAAGWALHPTWDLALHLLGPGHHIVPTWYAIACVSFDFAVALYIVYRYKIGR
ncbi:MAG: hypothetical protein EP343_07810 [Deltaproteobacteria bacterium]|nr:MAG: hypothetical protein EP343_07810 [Deltaproteobacteria bacterium]